MQIKKINTCYKCFIATKRKAPNGAIIINILYKNGNGGGVSGSVRKRNL